MSKDFPSQFGHNPNYRNPEGTVPFPRPADIPVTLWEQTETNVVWTGPTAVPNADIPGSAVGFTYGWVWKPPTFDLRPDLRSSDAKAKEGAVPIWSREARLYFTLRGIGAGAAPTALEGLMVRLQHHGNISTNLVGGARTTVVPMSPVYTVTNAIMQCPATSKAAGAVVPSDANEASFSLCAPGGRGGGMGYPMRYWSPRVYFNVIYTTADYPVTPNPPAFSFQAVYY